MQRWRPWEGVWNLKCSYQDSCLQWPPDQSLDLISLTWVDECNSSTYKIESAAFNLDSVCRGYEYYIDPFSDEVLELGTLQYPYRSFKNVLAEVIYLSHTDSDITIYTKDAYMEDGDFYFLNMSSVTILSHPEYSISGRRSILIPTKIPQIGLSGKSQFHLLNDSTIHYEDAIAAGNFTDIEIDFLRRDLVTIKVDRTSFYIESVEIYREETLPDSSQHFVMALYIQEKMIKAGNKINQFMNLFPMKILTYFFNVISEK